MKCSDLAFDCTLTGPDTEISGITQDSRAVRPGYLFAALKGEKVDGRDYIDAAIKNGAVAILGSNDILLPPGITGITHEEPRHALALIAARFYPKQPRVIAAITGTSGKTSTVQFLRQIWQHSKHKSASIGTLGIIGDGIERYGSLTTPETISLHQDIMMLAEEKHITHLAMEASSHGLEQHRLDGVHVTLAAFTNLSRDHLDYHKTMEAYLAAKLRLFRDVLAKDGVAVIASDIPEFPEIADVIKQRSIRMLTFGTGKADVALLERRFDAHGQDLHLSIMGKPFNTRIHLVGAFQAMNVLCAATLAIAGGDTTETVMDALPKLQTVRGRMEYVGAHQGGAVYVDYAHKPDALEQVLKALRPHAQGRLICVFGCGGNRDAGKRPMMGAIAQQFSDIVIVTDDNPRHEEAALIRKAVMEGATRATEIAGRGEAIAYALSLLQAGDVVVIAGKGHEQGQIIGDKILPFDDAAIAKNMMEGQAA